MKSTATPPDLMAGIEFRSVTPSDAWERELTNLSDRWRIATIKFQNPELARYADAVGTLALALSKEGNRRRYTETVRSSIERLEKLALEADARGMRPAVIRDAERYDTALKGVAAAAEASKSKAELWHIECVTHAKELLAQGKPARAIASILAKRFNRDASTIRKVLKEKRARRKDARV